MGPVALRATRAQLLGRVGLSPARSTGKALAWCVGGSTGMVTAAFGRNGRSLLVTSTALVTGLGRVRPGMSARALARAYPGHRALARGVWRLGSASRRIVGVRRGRVTFAGVAARELLARPRLLGRRLLLGGM